MPCHLSQPFHLGSYPKTTKGSDQEYEVYDEKNIYCSYLRDEDYYIQAFQAVLNLQRDGALKQGSKTF